MDCLGYMWFSEHRLRCLKDCEQKKNVEPMLNVLGDIIVAPKLLFIAMLPDVEKQGVSRIPDESELMRTSLFGFSDFFWKCIK